MEIREMTALLGNNVKMTSEPQLVRCLSSIWQGRETTRVTVQPLQWWNNLMQVRGHFS